jgi:class I fructose-bisphosphate aldolase
MRGTLQALVAGQPDAVTMHKGVATGFWAPYAGKVPLIVQASAIRPDDAVREHLANVEDAVRLGADALAIAGFVRGATEGFHLRAVADAVREAARFEMPIICHIYPRQAPDFTAVSLAPEDIAWAVRCAVEVGVDVVKTPYCGDISSYSQIVAECPVPLVAAGGPKTATLTESLASMLEVVESGARGATIGRNIWGSDRITATLLAYKAVIHDGKCPEEAIRAAGL